MRSRPVVAVLLGRVTRARLRRGLTVKVTTNEAAQLEVRIVRSVSETLRLR